MRHVGSVSRCDVWTSLSQSQPKYIRVGWCLFVRMGWLLGAEAHSLITSRSFLTACEVLRSWIRGFEVTIYMGERRKMSSIIAEGLDYSPDYIRMTSYLTPEVIPTFVRKHSQDVVFWLTGIFMS